MRAYEVRAHWDADADVWWVESNDVPGLVAEAKTLEEVIQDIRELVPALLQMNRADTDEAVLLKIVADRDEELRLA